MIELLERVGLGRPAELRPAHALGRQAELVEQQLAELLRRADVELLARELEDPRLERREPGIDLAAELLEPLGVDVNAHPLDLRQQARDRHLDGAIELLQATGCELRRQHVRDREQRVGHRARPRCGPLDLDALEAEPRAPRDRGARRHRHATEPQGDRLRGLGLQRGVEQKRREHRVVDDAVDLDIQARERPDDRLRVVTDLRDRRIFEHVVERLEIARRRRRRRPDVAVTDRDVGRRGARNRDHDRDELRALAALGIELDRQRHLLGPLDLLGERLDRRGTGDDPRIVACLDRGHRRDLRGRHDDHVVRGRHPDLDLLDEQVEFELGEQGEQLLEVPVRCFEIFELAGQRHVAAELDELARHRHALELLGIAERLLDLDPGYDRICIDQRLQRAVLLEQARGGLVTNAVEPRDVVRGVPDEREEVRNLLRRHAHLLDHLVARVRLLMERIDHRHVIADELHDVLVGAVDHDLPVLLARLGHERGDHVIGLDPRDGQHRPAEPVHDLREVVHLDLELLRRRLARRLVGRIHVRAERLPAALVVEHHRHSYGMVVLLEPHQHAREHVERAGRHTFGGREPDLLTLAARRVHEAVVGSKDVAVPVDDVEALSHWRAT